MRYMEIIDDLTKFYLPKVSEKLSEIGVSSAMYALKWIMCLYVNGFEVGFSIRVWDYMLLNEQKGGSRFLISVCIAILNKL